MVLYHPTPMVRMDFDPTIIEENNVKTGLSLSFLTHEEAMLKSTANASILDISVTDMYGQVISQYDEFVAVKTNI